MAVADDLADLAWAKRLLERAADPAFAERLRLDPDAAGAEIGAPWSPDRVRALWERGAGDEHDPLVTAWRGLMRRRLAVRTELRQAGAFANPAMDAWRERQIRRCDGELGPGAEALVHAPFAVELSQGCSMGCWFCGLAAGPLEETWAYTPDNAELWRGMLGVLREELGPAAQGGFCYWATEPLDNPDYERFLEDFREQIGVIPQTTTAAALRDPDRTRRVLAQARAGSRVVSRFSVLSPGMLRKVHRTFSPEELLEVELVLQFAPGRTNKAISGRLRSEQRERARREGLPVDREERAGTIACVSGFLIQPIARRVQLIAPCRACERWPKGYVVFGERTFADAESFRRALRALRDERSVQDLERVRPGRVWTVSATEEGLAADSGLVQMHLCAPGRREALRALAELVQAGAHPADTLGTLLFYTRGQSAEQTLADLDRLFRQGLLDEDPQECPRNPATAMLATTSTGSVMAV